MLLTLALIIFFSSILVVFSKEFIQLFKKIFSIKGSKLVIPLLIVSWVIYSFNVLFLSLLFYLREVLNNIVLFIVKMVPFHQGATSFSLIILLTLLSTVPIIIIDIFSRRRKGYKRYTRYKHPYLTSTLIWIIVVFLLVVT